jgi:hypothetical protein
MTSRQPIEDRKDSARELPTLRLIPIVAWESYKTPQPPDIYKSGVVNRYFFILLS